MRSISQIRFFIIATLYIWGRILFIASPDFFNNNSNRYIIPPYYSKIAVCFSSSITQLEELQYHKFPKKPNKLGGSDKKGKELILAVTYPLFFYYCGQHIDPPDVYKNVTSFAS